MKWPCNVHGHARTHKHTHAPARAHALPEQKAEWCKGDYCTLLSGGSGFAAGGAAGSEYVESPESAAQAARILSEAGIQ